MSLLCKHCSVDMKLGQAIFTHDHKGCCTGFGGGGNIPADQVNLIYCLKCPKCGHSEDLKDIHVEELLCNIFKEELETELREKAIDEEDLREYMRLMFLEDKNDR